MQKKGTSTLLKSTLNGAYHKGNFIWGAAMNQCWNTLCESIIKEPLKLKVDEELATHMIQNFNKSKFSKEDLKEDSYYTKAGYGQNTVETINKQCRLKFPKKEFADLKIKLQQREIISYAYFVKDVQYLNPFIIQPSFNFDGKIVQGFKAKSQGHFDNIRVCNYQNNDSFMIKLLLKQKDEELIIIKGYENALPQQIVEFIQKNIKQSSKVQKSEEFGMPIIRFDVNRKYQQLIGSKVLNKNFEQYIIGAMFQNIKFKIDEVGAKVQNEAVMVLLRSAVMPTKPKRKFIMNKPFWIVMKQKDGHPYFMVQINNFQFMSQSKK